MHDVLDGMRDFTHEACCGSQTDTMDILGIDRAGTAHRSTARIIPFPLKSRTVRKA